MKARILNGPLLIMTQPPSVRDSQGNRKEAGGATWIVLILTLLGVGVFLFLCYGESVPSQANINLLEIFNGQENYFATSGRGRYSDSLYDLQKAGMIELQLHSGASSGYAFSLPTGADGKTFSVTARPQEYGTTGTRSHFADQSGVVRYTDGNRSAGPEGPPL